MPAIAVQPWIDTSWLQCSVSVFEVGRSKLSTRALWEHQGQSLEWEDSISSHRFIVGKLLSPAGKHLQSFVDNGVLPQS